MKITFSPVRCNKREQFLTWGTSFIKNGASATYAVNAPNFQYTIFQYTRLLSSSSHHVLNLTGITISDYWLAGNIMGLSGEMSCFWPAQAARPLRAAVCA